MNNVDLDFVRFSFETIINTYSNSCKRLNHVKRKTPNQISERTCNLPALQKDRWNHPKGREEWGESRAKQEKI